jgi:hypothetical protein
MIVDCMTCPVRGQRCGDCAVTVLLTPRSADLMSSTRPAPAELALDAAESRAVSMFVGAGLVSARAVVGLRARCEIEQGWGSVRDAG